MRNYPRYQTCYQINNKTLLAEGRMKPETLRKRGAKWARLLVQKHCMACFVDAGGVEL